MGLTIHYTFTGNAGMTQAVALAVVRRMHQYAARMAEAGQLAQVSPIYEVRSAADFTRLKHEELWLAIQSGKWVNKGGHSSHVNPSAAFIFSTWPGEGCEAANFGLCRYPGAPAWSWSSFCKTQYATEVSLEHFLRCHMAVVALLDGWTAQPEITVSASDEGDYFEKRDLSALAGKIGDAFGRTDFIPSDDVRFIAPGQARWLRQSAEAVALFTQENGS